MKICKNNATRGANTAGMRGDSLIVEFGDTEYVITSDPMPTGRDREWKASATTIDGHQAAVYWMEVESGQIDLKRPAHAELV